MHYLFMMKVYGQIPRRKETTLTPQNEDIAKKDVESSLSF